MNTAFQIPQVSHLLPVILVSGASHQLPLEPYILPFFPHWPSVPARALTTVPQIRQSYFCSCCFLSGRFLLPDFHMTLPHLIQVSAQTSSKKSLPWETAVNQHSSSLLSPLPCFTAVRILYIIIVLYNLCICLAHLSPSPRCLQHKSQLLLTLKTLPWPELPSFYQLCLFRYSIKSNLITHTSPYTSFNFLSLWLCPSSDHHHSQAQILPTL